MSDLNASTISGKTYTATERSEVIDQCDRILESPWFRASVRCSTLLRHLVEGAVHGRSDQLKERAIAVKAFHRNPAYDNNTDPVVRVAAGEVRKRLAQYYNDPRNSGQIHIDLPIGSYVPEIRFPSEGVSEAHTFDTELPIQALEKQLGHGEPLPVVNTEKQSDLVFQIRIPRNIKKWAPAVILLIVIVCAGLWFGLRSTRHVSGFDAFWAPMLSAQRVTRLSIGDVQVSHAEFVPNSQRSPIAIPWSLGDKGFKWNEGRLPSFGNSFAAASVAAILAKNDKVFQIASQSRTTFDDLANHPVIQIGSFDNDWVLRDTNSMRFRFEINLEKQERWIADREKPSQQFGALPLATAMLPTFEDYSIVARSFDPATGQPELIIGGITSLGTIAAANFVTDPTYLNEFAQNAPKNWASKNMEILIATSIIDGAVGRSRIVAYSLW